MKSHASHHIQNNVNDLKKDMIKIISDRLEKSNLSVDNPELVAKCLLSHYDYNLQKVMEITI